MGMLISGWVRNRKVLFDLVYAMVLRNKKVQRIMLGQIELHPSDINILFEVKCRTKVVLKGNTIYIKEGEQ